MLRTTGMLRTTVVALTLTSVLLVGPVLAQGVPVSPKANPPLPDLTTFPVQLVIDDDSAEGVFGFDVGARPFLWFNRFANPGGTFTLEEIWVLFPNGADIPVGGTVQLAVFLDADGDPSNGANLLATYNSETVQVADGNTFSVYPLAPTLEISGVGDILIGVVNRYFSLGDPPPTRPAAFDSNLSQNRSYFALWPSNPPDPPDLATASTVDLLAGAASGNFMIRGFGTALASSLTSIPTLGGFGLAGLAVVLGLAGIMLVRRRAPKTIFTD